MSSTAMSHEHQLAGLRAGLRGHAADMRAAVLPAGPDDTDLILNLVAWIDREHQSDSNYCHPRVPDDCSDYCDACEVLRGVRDDVLIAARAATKARTW